ncbi:hypothetical protein [Streptococcus equinus]|uniref:hypothetical protein n=1 Tax=Streptococcus equinus TaxID=1335 RepID=UPI00215ACE47|nr:hypothetical protein [Streptococcus equinus]UVF02731.1 hypothetical protein KRG72_09070 [Streptococcus equinus]
MKKSIFNASFEESLNLEDDGFLQYYEKEQNEKTKKLSQKKFPTLITSLTSLVLTLLFPIGLNFILVAIIMTFRDDAENLTIPISKHELLTEKVYLYCLLLWLLFVLIGKLIKRSYLLPYRLHFHTVTYLIWLIFEVDLVAIEITLPTLTIYGILIFMVILLLLGYCMFRIKYRTLKEKLYAEKSIITKGDKIIKMLSIYGVAFLGIMLLIKQFLLIFMGEFSTSLKGLGLFATWFILNIGVVAMLIFMEFPYYLYAYYKLKYSEEYRNWEGKTVEEWYGKKYLKKHKELLEHE